MREINKTIYYADHYGSTYYNGDWPNFLNWMDKNKKHLDKFQFSTSNADASFSSDGFDKILESYDNGFSEKEREYLEEKYGILV